MALIVIMTAVCGAGVLFLLRFLVALWREGAQTGAKAATAGRQVELSRFMFWSRPDPRTSHRRAALGAKVLVMERRGESKAERGTAQRHGRA
jgi:hypothetical protein